ncbi:unnamed protein product [Blepharisma stoltei]|uniref:SHSP domain-containing protein n=1 Tax=Blepharisma stoltei TaxID=1481888 RepID=A0AAU9J5H4_9CILI|nr:unnamed protein product [Blepharisma stoltei]
MSRYDFWQDDNSSSFNFPPTDTSPSDTFLRHATDLFNTLTEEEEQITRSLPILISQQSSKQDQVDLIEAYALELKIRNQEKMNLLDSFLSHEKSHSLQVRQLEQEIKKLKEEASAAKNMINKRINRIAGTLNATDVYDWIVDIGLITDISKSGWEVEFSEKFWSSWGKTMESQADSKGEVIVKNEPNIKNDAGNTSWDGAVVSVVGLYDKGKTFLLNNLTDSYLPSGKKVNTRGLSFKHVQMDTGTNLILLDTAGSYSPVKVLNEFSVAEKEATELFILDMVFEISDYFICVVNDFTSLDQRFLDKITRSLQNSSTKIFREVIVVHNLKDVEDENVINHIWETQVTQIYGSGSTQSTKVAANSPESNELVEKSVSWFKTDYSRHVCLANADSEIGQKLNPWTFSLLKYWLKAVFVPVNRPLSVVETVVSIIKSKISSYFKTPVEVQLINGQNPLKKIIICKNMSQSESLRLPQFSMDSSGFIISRPDSFIPAVDIIEDSAYKIYMDISGLSKEDILLTRQNVLTVVQGRRKKPNLNSPESARVIKQERKYGDFAISFKIPEQYERRWNSFEVKDGVLMIAYNKDEDEISKMQ